MPDLNVILASTRPVRTGPTVADWFHLRARAHGVFDVVRTDLAEVDLPFLDEPEHASTGRYVHAHTQRWSAAIASADAVAFVMPEYNQGVPAALKNAIDYLYDEWRDKPVGLVAYGMVSAGAQAVSAIRPTIDFLHMRAAETSVGVQLPEVLDEDGILRPTPKMERDARTMLDELADPLAVRRDPEEEVA